MKPFEEIAHTATQVLSNIANKKSQAESSNADKDWDFCRHVYNKIKEIPDGDLKDELQMEILRMTFRAMRQCTNQPINQPIASYGTTGNVVCEATQPPLANVNYWNNAGNVFYNTPGVQQTTAYQATSGGFQEMLRNCDSSQLGHQIYSLPPYTQTLD